MLGRREHQRAGLEHVRQRARIVLRVRRDLGEGDVAGRVDEFAELPVGDRRAVDPEAVDRDPVDRRFFGVVPVRAHAERAAGNPHHVIVGQSLALECVGLACKWHRHSVDSTSQAISRTNVRTEL